MRIHLFVEHYPIPFKPYYDTQFVDLLRRGHDIRIFAGGRFDQTLNPKFVRHGLARRTRYYPTTLRTVPGRMAAALIGAAAELPRGLRAIRAVAEGGAGPKQGALDAMRTLVVGRGAPDLCIVHGLGTAAMFRWLRRVHRGVPIAMYYHGGEVPLVRPMDDATAESIFRAFDIIFTNTEFSRRHAIERGCPPDRVELLPVGFDLEDYRPPAERRYRRGGVLRLLSAGRMSEEKGFIHALEAIKRLVARGIRDISYSLTGQGYIRSSLERFVRENGLQPYVRFLGTLPTDQVIRAMGEADALVLPSIQLGNWVENQACAVQEAMLMKALVVTTTTGGVVESTAPELRRFSVPPADPEALARAIGEIHSLQPSDFRALGESARRFVVERYDISRLNETMIERALASVHSLAGRDGGREVRIASYGSIPSPTTGSPAP